MEDLPEMPQAVDQEAVDKIQKKYDKLLEMNKNDQDATNYLKTQCQLEIIKTIRKQRDDAIAAGGELGEKIKAEDEEYKLRAEKAVRSKYSVEEWAAIKKREAEIEEERRKAREAARKNAKFCPECGCKLPEDAKFCPECGYKI